MSFTKTVSTIAALASIFGTSVLAYKLVQRENQQPLPIEEKITELEEKLKQAEKQPTIQEPTIQEPTIQEPVIVQQPPQVLPPLPPLPPVPEPKPGEFE